MLTLACQAEKAPLLDVVSAELVVDDSFDNEYMATYRSNYVYIKINAGTWDKPEIKTLIIDDHCWGTGRLWREYSKIPGRSNPSSPWDLWNYVSHYYNGQERQVLKVKKHSGRWDNPYELVFVAPKAPAAQAGAHTAGSDKRRSTGTGSKTSEVSMSSTVAQAHAQTAGSNRRRSTGTGSKTSGVSMGSLVKG